MISTTKIKIAIVEDELLFRKSLLFFLNKEDNMEIIFDGGNGEELIDFLSDSISTPDIVITDIRMPVFDGIDTAKHLTEHYPDIKIIALSAFHSDSFIEQMINYGVSSYLLKDSTPDEVITAINQVYESGTSFSSRILNAILKIRKKSDDKSERFYKLSQREIEILKLVCEQYNTKEIADMLCLSERTIEGHRKKLLEKTDSKNVVGLVLWGIKNHILSID